MRTTLKDGTEIVYRTIRGNRTGTIAGFIDGEFYKVTQWNDPHQSDIVHESDIVSILSTPGGQG